MLINCMLKLFPEASEILQKLVLRKSRLYSVNVCILKHITDDSKEVENGTHILFVEYVETS